MRRRAEVEEGALTRKRTDRNCCWEVMFEEDFDSAANAGQGQPKGLSAKRGGGGREGGGVVPGC